MSCLCLLGRMRGAKTRDLTRGVARLSCSCCTARSLLNHTWTAVERRRQWWEQDYPWCRTPLLYLRAHSSAAPPLVCPPPVLFVCAVPGTGCVCVDECMDARRWELS